MDLGSLFALHQFWMHDSHRNAFHGNTYVGHRRSTLGFDEIQNLATPLTGPADGVQNVIVGVILQPTTRATTITTIPQALGTRQALINSVVQEYLRLSRSGIAGSDQRSVHRLFGEVVWEITHFLQAPRIRRDHLAAYRTKLGGPNQLRGG
jgi:hypothetical protein